MIAIDIDSTLYDFTQLAQEEALKRGGDAVKVAYSAWQDWRTPPDLIGLDAWLEVIAECHSDESILRQEPFPGSVATVRELNDAGHELKYVTTRDPSTAGATEAWLVKHRFPQANKLFASWDDKQPIIADCQYLIDDRPKTVIQFVYGPAGESFIGTDGRPERRAFVKAHPYNINLTDVPGIYVSPTWAGIRQYLQKKGVLPQHQEV